jgi:16S rRNA (uracil1498-N3)-methyltransferase
MRDMARRRFFVPFVRNDRAELSGDDARHLTQVLRVEPGQVFELSDNSAVYLAEVASVRKSEVAFRVLERLPDLAPETPIHLFVSLFKFDRLETLLEKATELGVTSVTFVRTERTEKGLDKAAEKRMERWRRITVEASQQSRRVRLPELSIVSRWTDMLRANDTPLRLILDEDRTGAPLLDLLQSMPPSVAMLVGPEGGWTDEERTQARQAGWTPASMGSQILRAETAGIAALAVANAVLLRGQAPI